ncbi:MAG: amino acid adenylation domain-containing protein, partial [Candidatus Aminicenantes bacterium]|nr:amino acid adenylation domain-containing protein [Candidatus Aminicenantes bacterium]
MGRSINNRLGISETISSRLENLREKTRFSRISSTEGTEKKEIRQQIEAGDKAQDFPHHSSFITHNSALHNSALEFIRPFDLSQAPLLRVGLISDESGGDNHILVVDMHHIISDGVSRDILVQDFMAFYEGKGKGLQPFPIQYKEFSAWQNLFFKSGELEKQEKYWENQLAGEIPVIDLPADYKRPPALSFAGSNVVFEMGREKAAAIRKIASDRDATLFMVMLAAVNIFLSKLCGQEDIILGTPIAGRRHADLERIIGMFVNTLVLRNYPRGEETFTAFLKEIKKSALSAFENQDYPFEEFVEKAVVTRDISRNPLFDIMFVLENMDVTGIDVPGLKLKSTGYEAGVSKFDLTIGVKEAGAGLLFNFRYRTGLFKEETILKFIDYFKKVTNAIIENPDVKIAGIEILSPAEKQQLLFDFNDTAAGYPHDKLLHGLFAEQVEKTPDRAALVGPEVKTGYRSRELVLTYSRLNSRANQLARSLIEKGLEPGTPVGLMVERSIDMIVGILAVLKAGSPYLPIDPGYPAERIGYMIKDSRIKMLLSRIEPVSDYEAELPGNEDKQKFCGGPGGSFSKAPPGRRRQESFLSRLGIEFSGDVIDPGDKELYKRDDSDPGIAMNSREPAYIIYTSGSTGRPKGVLVEHNPVVNLTWNQGRFFDITKHDRILQFSSICFDPSVEQIFTTLTNGAVLVLIDKETLMDIDRFVEFIVSRSITHLHAVPSFLQILHESLLKKSFFGSTGSQTNSQGPLWAGGASPLKRIVSGGDVCPVSLAKKWSRYGEFYNKYGPTETTITSIEMKFDTVDDSLIRLPIGKPVNNTRVYLLDKWEKLVPVGVAGEMYIGGSGVARGYLNNPELTAEKFITVPAFSFQHQPAQSSPITLYRTGEGAAHPPSESHTAQSSPITPHQSQITLYRTGDMARWLADGTLDFLGRIDRQVKVRGFRIELEEIENVLLTQAGIKEAVVLLKQDINGDKYLCAYIVLDDEISLPHASFVPGVKEHLARELPDYMIPPHFVMLEEMPLTPNGKVDRKALPAPEIVSGREYAAPRNDIEEALVYTWSQVLGIEREKIGIDDNFFELGGHSLKATAVVAKLHRELDAAVTLAEVFKTPTIRELARCIDLKEKSRFVGLSPVEAKEYYPSSPAQKRFFFFQQLEPENMSYNMPDIMIADGPLEKEKPAAAFKQLIQRHESLRTSFKTVDGEVVQQVHDARDINFEIEFYDVTSTIDISFTPGEGDEVSTPSIYEIEPAAGIAKSFIRPFDLSKAPLMRLGLIKTRAGKTPSHIIMVDMHHIISDGVSTGIFIADFLSIYRGEEPLPLRFRYRDYVQWLLDRRKGEEEKEHTGQDIEEELLELPTDYVRPAVQSFAGTNVSFSLDKEVKTALNSLALKEDSTLFMVLFAIFNVFLSKLSSQENIIVGSPIAGRLHDDLEGIVGLFINTLAIRNFPEPGKSFTQFLKEVKENSLHAFESQEYQYEELIEKVAQARSSGRNPLFDVMFVLQNMEMPELEIPGLRITRNVQENTTSKFDMTLYCLEEGENLDFFLEYGTKLFKPGTIKRFIKYFEKVVSVILADPGKKIGEIEFISAEEKREILYDFNDTEVEYPRHKTIYR